MAKILCALAAIVIAIALVAPTQAQRLHSRSLEFDQFAADLWKDAQAQGVNRATFNRAFAGITPNPRVIASKPTTDEQN